MDFSKITPHMYAGAGIVLVLLLMNIGIILSGPGSYPITNTELKFDVQSHGKAVQPRLCRLPSAS